MDYTQRAYQLINEMNFPAEARLIDPKLLIIALTPPEGTKLLPQNIIDAVGEYDYELFEFLGDAVLEIAVTDHIYLDRVNIVGSSGTYTKRRSNIVNNMNLKDVFGQLCELMIIPPDEIVTDKMCADVFEAILGAVYIHLKYQVGHDRVIDIIQHWIFNTLPPYGSIEPQVSIAVPSKKILDYVYKRLYNWGEPVIESFETTVQGTESCYGKRDCEKDEVCLNEKCAGKMWLSQIKCPPQINCRKKTYIGVAVEKTQKWAEEKASEEAINTLKSWGYRTGTVKV